MAETYSASRETIFNLIKPNSHQGHISGTPEHCSGTNCPQGPGSVVCKSRSVIELPVDAEHHQHEHSPGCSLTASENANVSLSSLSCGAQQSLDGQVVPTYHTVSTSATGTAEECSATQLVEVEFDIKWEMNNFENDINTSRYPSPADWRRPKVLFTDIGESGSALSALLLSELYAHGEILIKDVLKAAFWLRYAARQGDVEAMCKLHSLLNNHNIKPLNNESMDHWRKEGLKRGAYWEEYIDWDEVEILEDERLLIVEEKRALREERHALRKERLALGEEISDDSDTDDSVDSDIPGINLNKFIDKEKFNRQYEEVPKAERIEYARQRLAECRVLMEEKGQTDGLFGIESMMNLDLTKDNDIEPIKNQTRAAQTDIAEPLAAGASSYSCLQVCIELPTCEEELQELIETIKALKPCSVALM